MAKMTAVLKWFVFYDGNVMETKYYHQLPENQIEFRLLSKNAHLIDGEFPEGKNLKNVRLECWSSMDLIWEESQWGEWVKTFIQKFPSLRMLKNRAGFYNGEGYHDWLCESSESTIITRFDSEMRTTKEWLDLKDTKISLPVHYDPMTGKPRQSMLLPERIAEFYEKGVAEPIVEGDKDVSTE